MIGFSLRWTCVVLWVGFAFAGDSRSRAVAEDFKQLPPPGISLDADDRASLVDRVNAIQAKIVAAKSASDDADAWSPDVEVLVRSVRLALEQNGFYKASEVKDAGRLLDEAQRRLQSASSGKRGLALLADGRLGSKEPLPVIGGFKSDIDDSVQPFGLVIPAGYTADDASTDSKYRMDIWLHGRGDTKTEIAFLKERMTKVGQYSPGDTFVLHPFGRHCVAFKFAGETDVDEAIQHVSELLEVDSDRIAMRGFSMGGAGVWHLGVHQPSRWFAVNPGAGFVDTIVYQGWSQKMPFELTDTRRKLLNWYDVLPWVTNLRNTELVAYSGEVDKQRQAAERVTQAAGQQGIPYQHIIGKGMGHKIDPPSAQKIDAILDDLASQQMPAPRTKIDFVTYLLRYHRSDWLSVDGLTQQFQPGHVVAEVVGDHAIEMTTSGVTRLRLDFADSGWPADRQAVTLDIDQQQVLLTDTSETAGLQVDLVRDESGGAWLQSTQAITGLQKRPGMQGPIDDAFCQRFVFVTPSRPATHGRVQRWIDRETKYAIRRWETLMRGQANVVQDTEVTDEMIQTCNLVCFGDFTSNRLLAKLAGQLPIQWTKDGVSVGDRQFDPVSHVPVFCYPNPLNLDRYIVVNSGMTFREFSNVSNSRQIAMLPDWAVLSVDSEDDGIFAGDVVADGFFDEQWKIKRDEVAND
ncbi:Prolyl oligopeptidase family protein [Rubripirellula lacrimiformis]|uniref:Prolyl oligopeptidase family protein n=1 Tax=Rubripirellula lacrimiformis TaxID=1930273 RepID=A0A517NKP6_9BACT|nr:prolyl oligopeptidase family serine peptidase [Rubripirellula lacrimiformis]QDT07701.1 Prolyl oligopeptidase family protein [Rubripirellula lacrimiformis]